MDEGSYHPLLAESAASSNHPLEKPLAVVSPQFCSTNPIDLVIVRKTSSLSGGNFEVADVTGNLMFKVKGKPFNLRDRHIMVDAADNPILSFQQKIVTKHNRWRVFKGDSIEEKDLLFSVRNSSIIQLKTNLDVFLASNTCEDECDFKLEDNWSEMSCNIYSGLSTNIIAQMHKKNTMKNVILGRDTDRVTVYQNVDYAFIVALISILEEINHVNGAY